ncbi:MAG: MoaD/ThiS family protein [Actinomycetales bacterium]|nr:MoaD/ThiS family protein [Candidatus Phosphoribacter baldrii]
MPSATVLVRYWAAARAAAGVDTESVTLPEGQGEGEGQGQGQGEGQGPATVGSVLDEVTTRHTELGRVLRVATVLVNGRAADRAWTLADGDVVEVLPPFAGG